MATIRGCHDPRSLRGSKTSCGMEERSGVSTRFRGMANNSSSGAISSMETVDLSDHANIGRDQSTY